MIDLLDVNVWVACVDARHTHHSIARDYWDRIPSLTRAFCRITMLGFLRIITSARACLSPKTPAEAWTIYQEFMAISDVEFLAEPAPIEEHFETLTTASAFPHRLWTDAYLAAFAMANGCRLVSFDGDFSRFAGLNFLHLTP
jgi:toxin-antitoxin system PIN domain toxin